MKKAEILRILKEVSSEVKRNYKAEIKGIFGSYVRGESQNESDVDILVDFDDTADLFDLVGLSQFLEEKLKCKVDIVPQDDIREELRDNILKEAVYL